MKKYLLIAVASICVTIVFSFFLFNQLNSQALCIALDRSRFEKLKLDISIEEAIGIIGIPPGEYASGKVVNINPSLINIRRETSSFKRTYIWSDDATFLSIAIDEEGKVCSIFAICNQRVY